MTYPRPFHGHTTAAPATRENATSSSTSGRMGTSTGTRTTENTPTASEVMTKARALLARRDIRALKTHTPEAQAGIVTVPLTVLPKPYGLVHGKWTR